MQQAEEGTAMNFAIPLLAARELKDNAQQRVADNQKYLDLLNTGLGLFSLRVDTAIQNNFAHQRYSTDPKQSAPTPFGYSLGQIGSTRPVDS